MTQTLSQAQKQELLPMPGALVLGANKFTFLTPSGEVINKTPEEIEPHLGTGPILFCYTPHLHQMEFSSARPVLDLLELFAFVCPAEFCVPTPVGLAKALDLDIPETAEEESMTLLEVMEDLLYRLKNDPYKEKVDPLLIAQMMGQKGKGWAWTPYIFNALGNIYDVKNELDHKHHLKIWKHLPEWSEEAPAPPASHQPVTGEEAVGQLEQLLKEGKSEIETRDVQKDYARHVSSAFSPVDDEDETHIILAEAGTGVGKTLGYLSPASVWAEKNQGTVWLSTYTKNLQRQIDQELTKLYPDKEVREAKTAIRKGRENYLCLLNLEDALNAAPTSYDPKQAIAAGLMARWALATRDGDLTGQDFPGWLATLLGFQKSTGLADRRGECIYAACDHFHKCFVERAARKGEHARIVVANHALVMIQTAIAAESEDLPTRYVFDEGHHLFDAADSAFSVHFSARETRELRRWILGPEGGKVNRMRGLHRRLEDLIKNQPNAETALNSLQHHARQLPGSGWTKRLSSALPDCTLEIFFKAVYEQVHARSDGKQGPYSLETNMFPATEEVLKSAIECRKTLSAIQRPMIRLATFMRQRLADDTEGMLSADERRRLDGLASSLERRAHNMLASWIALLLSLESQQESDGFIDWMEVTRIDGQAIDVGAARHWIDPMVPFAASIKPHAHGIAVTSATLRDPSEEGEEYWNHAKSRTGADYLSRQPVTFEAESPFDYKNQSKVFLVNDVRKDDPAQIASAYQALFKASDGSALGLFTAVQRLKSVYGRIIDPLSQEGLKLYAQHMDDMDVGTLIDIFRDEEKSCLLGTDAIRDGVDVPGKALQLIVFDRVPWPRPTILHKARREKFGRKQYDDMMTALKLKQAFGRLIRKKDDKGVFVLLDPMLPSRLHSAFPRDIEIVKCGLSEAVKEVKDFLHD